MFENLVPLQVQAALTSIYLTCGNTSSNNAPTCPGLVFCAQEPEILEVHPIPKFSTLLQVQVQENTTALVEGNFLERLHAPGLDPLAHFIQRGGHIYGYCM